MAAGTILSGKNGTLKLGSGNNEVAHLTNWKAKATVKTDQFSTNSSGGYDYSIPGTGRWEGSFMLVLHDGEPLPVREGDQVDAQFHLDSSDGEYLDGTITIVDIELDVDVKDGKAVQVPVTWQGHGDLTETGDYLGGS